MVLIAPEAREPYRWLLSCKQFPPLWTYKFLGNICRCGTFWLIFFGFFGWAQYDAIAHPTGAEGSNMYALDSSKM